MRIAGTPSNTSITCLIFTFCMAKVIKTSNTMMPSTDSITNVMLYNMIVLYCMIITKTKLVYTSLAFSHVLLRSTPSASAQV
jgi:hypothetical protein